MVKAFSNGEMPLTASRISSVHEIPIRLVRQILYELADSRIISVTHIGESMEPAYQPARDTNLLTISYIIEALEQRGDDNIHFAQSRGLRALSDALEEFRNTIEKSPTNRLLKDI